LQPLQKAKWKIAGVSLATIPLGYWISQFYVDSFYFEIIIALSFLPVMVAVALEFVESIENWWLAYKNPGAKQSQYTKRKSWSDFLLILLALIVVILSFSN